MIFSAGFESYRCTTCKADVQDVIPTSIIPMLGVGGFAGAGWATALFRLTWTHWTRHIAVFIIATLSLWLICEIVERITNRALRAGRCPYCSGPLERTGGGFHDGCVPNPYELLVYVFTIASAVVASYVTSVVHAGG